MLLLAGTPAPRLVMAGYTLTQEMRNYIADHMLTDSVIEAFNPTSEELRSLYTGAAALLFPSLYEGFGWPLIEAQSCGCPVITSNRPPMTEVAGDAALYIDPADEPGAGARIADGFDRLPLLREAGFRNVQRFNPDRIGEEYERFFFTVVGGTTSQAGSGVVQPEPSIETIGKP
jgi:glycosyltransferase involved in cell wall biosynthesis